MRPSDPSSIHPTLPGIPALHPRGREAGAQRRHTMTTTTSLTGRIRAPQTAEKASPPPRRPRGAWARRAPLLPALIFMIVVTQLPFVGTVVISFMRWNALDPGD